MTEVAKVSIKEEFAGGKQKEVNGRKKSLSSSGLMFQGLEKSNAQLNWESLRKKSRDRIRLVRGKHLCVVTGAGHGLGRSIAGLVFQDQGVFPLAFAGSRLVLVDKDEDALKETSGKKMRQFLKHRKIEVVLEVVDLSNIEKTQQFIDDLVAATDQDYEHIILINNSLSLGNISVPLVELSDTDEMNRYWNENMTSRMLLTTQFCKLYPFSKKTVVHTAINDSTVATPSLGFSCMTTAAISAFAEVFSMENPTVRVLNFTTNRLDTSLFRNTILEKSVNEDLKESVTNSIENGELEPPLEAAKKLTKVLEEYEFTKGKAMFVNLKNKEIELNGEC